MIRMMIHCKTFPIVIAFLVLLPSCDTWTENSSVMKVAPEYEGITPDLVRANIATTDATPNTTPKAVKNDRSLWSHRLFNPRETVRISSGGEPKSLRTG